MRFNHSIPTLCIHVDNMFYAISSKQNLSHFATETAFYQWAKIEKERSAVILEFNEVQVIKIPSTQSLSDDDLLLALNYENASLLNKNPEDCLSSCLKQNSIEGKSHDSFVSVFDKKRVFEEVAYAQRYGVQLQAMGGLALYIIKTHFQTPKTASNVMMILTEKESFLACINEQGMLVTRNITSGYLVLQEQPDAWSAQIQRRLSLFKDKQVTVYCAESLNVDVTKINLLFNAHSTDIIEFKSLLQTFQNMYKMRQMLFPSLEAKKEHMVSIYSVLLLLVVCVCVGLGIEETLRTKMNIAYAQEELKLIQKETQIINQYRARIESQRTEIDALMRTFVFCGEPSSNPKIFFEIVDILAQYNLLQTRIISITLEGDSLSIEGDSVNQEDFTLFSRHFQNLLLRHDYILKTEWIEKRKNENYDVLCFKLIIKKELK